MTMYVIIIKCMHMMAVMIMMMMLMAPVRCGNDRGYRHRGYGHGSGDGGGNVATLPVQNEFSDAGDPSSFVAAKPSGTGPKPSFRPASENPCGATGKPWGAAAKSSADTAGASSGADGKLVNARESRAKPGGVDAIRSEPGAKPAVTKPVGVDASAAALEASS